MENNVLDTSYHTSDSSINTHFKSLYYDIMKNHNYSIIENINNVLEIKYFYINKDKVVINTKIQNILTTIIKYINSKTIYAKSIENPVLETYRKQIYSYIGHHLFHKIKNDNVYMYICYTDIHTLFPGLDNATDIIAKTKRTLSSILFSQSSQKGGNRIKSTEYTIGCDYIFDFNIETDVDYNKKIKELLIENTGEAIKFSLYYIASKYDFESDEDKYETIYNIYNTLFNFYTYSGTIITNLGFLENVFELYKEERLSKMSLKEFDTIIEEWKGTQPNQEELEAKRMDDWEKSIKKNSIFSQNYTRKRGRSLLNLLSPKRNKTMKISKSRG